MAKHLPLVRLDTRADQLLLGLWLALVLYLVEPLVVLAHEGAHALAYLLVGYPVVGLFISPFIGQVLGLYPAGLDPKQALTSAAGPLGGLALGYAVAWLSLAKRRSWGLWAESALLAILYATLMAEPGYLVSGALSHFGDPYWVARYAGLPPGLLAGVGVGLTLLNAPLVFRALRRWADAFVLPTARRQVRPALLVFLVCLALISVPYWIPTLLFIGRSQ